MKKHFCLLLSMLGILTFAQGRLNLFNYNAYTVYNSLAGFGPAPSCLPSVSITTALRLDSGVEVTYDGYYNSGTFNPPIPYWTLSTSGGSVTTQPHDSPILNTPLATNADWKINKFSLRYPNGTNLPNGGGSVGTFSCGGLVVDYAGGPGYAYEAFWFTAGGETYFIIQ